MKTRRVTTLPGSEGLFSPRWSPDGRYLVALPSGARGLRLFDFKTQKWSVLEKEITTYPRWSRDSKHIYYLHVLSGPTMVERVAVPGGKIEQVASLKGFQMTGYWGIWFGHTPHDVPLVLKDAGTEEIVSMKWHQP